MQFLKSLKVNTFVTLGLLLSATAVNAASVYKVSKDKDVVYIGGTFHILTEKDYPLPEQYQTAYKQSQELIFETDVAALDSPEFMQKSMGVILYQDGNTLKTGLNEATFARLSEYTASRQIDINQFMPLNPTGVMLTITIMEYQARGFVADGVDSFYFKKAGADKKKVSWFESPDEQLAIIDSFDNEDPNGLINYTLDEIDGIDKTINDLHQSWRVGDMDKLTTLGIDAFKDYPEVYKVVLKDRNDKWMSKIKAMFGDDDTEFVLVGALHLPGKDGVLTQLEALGYSVEKL